MKVLPPLRPSRLLGLAVLGAALLGTTGCVSLDEHKKLQSAFEEQGRQLASAENDLKNARAQIDALNARIAQLESLLKAGGGAALQKERDLLAAEVARLQAEVKRLTELAGTPTIPGIINDALIKLAEQYPDLLEYDPKLGMIRFKSDMTFALGSTDVNPRAREALKVLAGILNNALIATNEIRIVGHTDDIPIRQGTTMVMNPSNWYLSTNRAQSVRQVLQSDGVADLRMEPAGWGDTRPIVPNAAGHKGNEKNRRVEIYILPSVVPDNAIPGGAEHVPTAAPAPRRTPRTPATPTPRTPTTAPAVPLPVPTPG